MNYKVKLLISSYYSGDVPRVDGQLAVARAFGDKSLKGHLSSEPDVVIETIDDDTEFAILASDGIWKVGYLLSFLIYLQFREQLPAIEFSCCLGLRLLSSIIPK